MLAGFIAVHGWPMCDRPKAVVDSLSCNSTTTANQEIMWFGEPLPSPSNSRSGMRLLIGQKRLLQADGLARPMSVSARSALLLEL